MKKSDVIEFFGNRKEVAYALDITSQAIVMWDAELGPRLTDRVIAAAIRVKGVTATREQWPEAFKRRAS